MSDFNNNQSQQDLSLGLKIVSFLCWPAGLFFWYSKKDNEPVAAKSAAKFAIIGVVVGVILGIINALLTGAAVASAAAGAQ